MLNIPGQNKTGMLSTPAKVDLDNERLTADILFKLDELITDVKILNKKIDKFYSR
ncbi:hypothetical protein [Paraclostridium sp. AKS81]|uniref:hypothetical protein n=1 Tax=Paraclostridium sp. AKS81 TaxID=2876117 RepID=UPI0021E0ACEE|nr:hypothetical protein [Paraclostridium sp. AKS81]MCU9811197.1 hypothetical protein [Paraclostridium sp. AKS81]